MSRGEIFNEQTWSRRFYACLAVARIYLAIVVLALLARIVAQWWGFILSPHEAAGTVSALILHGFAWVLAVAVTPDPAPLG